MRLRETSWRPARRLIWNGSSKPATGPAGLMEMAHFDIGEVLRKELGSRAPKSVRLVIGNPLIMKAMVTHVPDAASYAPVTVLIDERPDGVYLSYDLMASFLAPYGNAQASAVAAQLDERLWLC
jgi:uncharacterized protein (DUF302 family)